LPRADLEDGLNAARMLIPKCWFDAEKCERGLEALRQYRRDWDEKLQNFRNKPLHDWCSHAADAFRYLAEGIEHCGLGSMGYRRKKHRYRSAMAA
jgi:hypothetical protein